MNTVDISLNIEKIMSDFIEGKYGISHSVLDRKIYCLANHIWYTRPWYKKFGSRDKFIKEMKNRLKKEAFECSVNTREAFAMVMERNEKCTA
jgi:hypothetical protein